MSFDLTPFRAGAVRLPKEIQQAIAYQDHLALIASRRIQNIAVVSQVGLLAVASLTNLEGQLVKQVPLAEARLQAVADTATAAITAEIIKLAW